jgi:polysaccharide deacetylase family protein (PEP-CTERM system associated)
MEVKASPTVSGANGHGGTAVPLQSSVLAYSPAPTASTPPSICTVTLEDYFHSTALRPWIRAETWYRFDSRLEASTHRTLEFLASRRAQATFFVGADVAAQMPRLLREISGHGHELAAAGDRHVHPASFGRTGARRELLRCREELEQATGHRVYGYRSAAGWLENGHLWLLEAIGEAGFAYDSSIRPALLSDPLARLRNGHRSVLPLPSGLTEVALSSVGLWGVHVPIGSGSAFRLLPWESLRRAITLEGAKPGQPYVMHIRTWELDPEQPRIQGTSTFARLRHYRNLERMSARLSQVFAAQRFISIASHLNLRPAPAHASRPPTETPAMGRRSYSTPRNPPVPSRRHSRPVTVVVPCFNETQSLRYLGRTLGSLKAAYQGQYAFTLLFVDDCSTDGTWELLQELFGRREDCILVRHERNQGVAAAIQTGLRRARTDIVCSIDCDCTYDPHELGRMIPLLADGVDVVTASPYHPAGSVRNVPAWRLLLSKTLSRLYRVVLHQKLFTYTSCFRVYRRESAAAVAVRRPGFLGVAEMIAQLDLAGRQVVEYPTTLEVRVLGHSKMKLLQTVIGHVGLLLDVVRARVTQAVTAPRVTT